MKSIRAKLSILVVTAVAGAVLAFTLYSAWSDAVQRFEAKRLELNGVAAAIATSVSKPLADSDRPNVARMLSAVGRIPGLTYARVTDEAGRSVHEYGFGVIVAREPGAVTPNPEIGPFSVFYLATYPVTADIVHAGRTIGRLTLIADLSPLRGAAMSSLMTALVAGLLAGLIGLVLSQRLQRSISDPVLQLTSAMEEIRRTNDFSHRVARTSDDEIGTLVDSFNGMLMEIRARDQRLAQHRDELELKVAERTSELASAKLAAEAASAAKSDFLATMSHEIRTPMNGMLVMAELLSSASLPPRSMRYAQVMLSSGQTLLAIINDILDFSKIEAGKLELESIPVSPRTMIDDVVKLFGERAEAEGLGLAAMVSADVPAAVSGDPVRLRQVLSNLVNNALKFTPEGGVSVAASYASGADEGGALTLTVSDTGIGIPADKVGTIFEAFSQADQSTTRRFGGTGIGLTICRRLVEAMGGTMGVRSTEGEGSSFHFTIPVVALAPAPAMPQVSYGEPDAILVVLDEGPVAQSLAAAARDRGLAPRRVSPGDVTPDLLATARAVFAPVSAMGAISLMCRDAGPGASPNLVALISFGAGATSIADLSLSLPLGSEETSAVFDLIAQGRAAIAEASRERGDAEAVAQAGAPLPLAGLRVLAADDNAVNREVLIEALARLGAEALCVEDGAQAVEAFSSGTFDAVLMDCSMPVMDGLTATRHLRSIESERGQHAIPVIALTAHVIGQKADDWRQAGMTGYLTKPYTLSALQACLVEATGGGRAPALAAAGDAGPDVCSAAQGLVDGSVLDGIVQMQRPGDDLAGRVVRLYKDHAPRALEAILALAPGGSAAEIATAAHALKSLSCNIGATEMTALCTELERDGRAGRVDRVAELCEALRTCLPPTLAALDALITATPPADPTASTRAPSTSQLVRSAAR